MSDTLMHLRGSSFPLGATLQPGGANFSVFSKGSESVELLLFRDINDISPERVIPIDRQTNRTYYYWHIFVPGIGAGQIYAYRARGSYKPRNGHRFDDKKVLIDPYGRCIAKPDAYNRKALSEPGDTAPCAMKSVVADTTLYDWEDDAPPRTPFARTIIYELHVGGFTRHPSSGVALEKAGTYAGLIEKIPYLVDLGISAVELLPVFAFDREDGPPGLGNYWGYSPISFFAPHPGYSSSGDPLGVLDEFRDMVKALHRAGIEVILDVVYNHTAEGGHDGPTISFRGLSNEEYYILQPDKELYADYTGCGNTLNANEPVCRRMILDSLRYWVDQMHIDGFRFDLASILARDKNGLPMASPPVLWDIESDPVLANVKLIAEAWDAAGLYQVGKFVGDSWKEWNGRFRDDIRAFIKGDNGMARAVGYRLAGSPDIYWEEEREPEQSVNFITCHDGFTLNDLVSYNTKHNEANGEENRDGSDFNLSWNCGVEGPSTDEEIKRLRKRQIKNFLTITMLAIGTPMLLMGDEAQRTQKGNNNAYCQDNEISWFDWDLIKANGDISRFVKQLIDMRKGRHIPLDRLGMTLNELLRLYPVAWHGVRLNAPDWSDNSHSIAATVTSGPFRAHLIVNSYWESLDFEIPRDSGTWRRCIDTYLDPPDDINDWRNAPAVQTDLYSAGPRSVVFLVGIPPNAGKDEKHVK
jgi:isoamylase